MVAGIGAGHFGYFSVNFGLFGDFQNIIDFYIGHDLITQNSTSGVNRSRTLRRRSPQAQ